MCLEVSVMWNYCQDRWQGWLPCKHAQDSGLLLYRSCHFAEAAPGEFNLIELDWCISPFRCNQDLDRVRNEVHEELRQAREAKHAISPGVQLTWEEGEAITWRYRSACKYHMVDGCLERFYYGVGMNPAMRADMGQHAPHDVAPQVHFDTIPRRDRETFQTLVQECLDLLAANGSYSHLAKSRSAVDQYLAIIRHKNMRPQLEQLSIAKNLAPFDWDRVAHGTQQLQYHQQASASGSASAAAFPAQAGSHTGTIGTALRPFGGLMGAPSRSESTMEALNSMRQTLPAPSLATDLGISNSYEQMNFELVTAALDHCARQVPLSSYTDHAKRSVLILSLPALKGIEDQCQDFETQLAEQYRREVHHFFDWQLSTVADSVGGIRVHVTNVRDKIVEWFESQSDDVKNFVREEDKVGFLDNHSNERPVRSSGTRSSSNHSDKSDSSLLRRQALAQASGQRRSSSGDKGKGRRSPLPLEQLDYNTGAVRASPPPMEPCSRTPPMPFNNSQAARAARRR